MVLGQLAAFDVVLTDLLFDILNKLLDFSFRSSLPVKVFVGLLEVPKIMFDSLQSLKVSLNFVPSDLDVDRNITVGHFLLDIIDLIPAVEGSVDLLLQVK